jgi:zinc protease
MRSKSIPAVLTGALALALCGAVPAIAQKRPVSSYKELHYPPLHKIQVPEPVRFEMPNGMTVYLVEDHELPMISVAATIRVGSRWEPVDQAGLASITGSVMRTGGTASRNGDQLDEELDRLGAYVETGIGDDSGNAEVSVLKEDIDKGLTILADVIQHPAFPQDKIDLAKIAQRDRIARRNDNPMGIAFREFSRTIYGKDSAYAHQTEYATIDAIQRADLVAFHKQFFQPENVILGAWGDFQSAEMRGRIEKAFGGWARGGRPKPETPAVDPGARKRAGIYLINKDDVNQTTVVMGKLGGRRDDPDYFALNVMNDILGNGFASRLFSQVRSEQGLAYAVGSQWAAEYDHPGVFSAMGGTKSETTVKIIRAIQHEIDKMAQGEVTDDELQRAKDSILKGAAFDYDSTEKIVQRLMSYEYFGYPRDYLQRYQDGIRKVSKEDVERAAKQQLKSDEFAILVLGKEKDFDQPLSTLGKVTPIDITIPKPKEQALAAATPESIAKGKDLLGRVRKAMGGDALLAVKDYSSQAELTISMGQGQMTLQTDSTVNLSGKAVNKMNTPMGEMLQGYDGQTAWTKTPQGVQEAPASARAEVEAQFFRDPIALVRGFDAAGLVVQALGASADGLEGVAVSDPARKLQVKLFVDPKTNLIAKKIYTGSLMGAPGELEEVYDDYRDAGGIKLPYHMVINQAGKKRMESKVKSIQVNPGLEDAAYKKP